MIRPTNETKIPGHNILTEGTTVEVEAATLGNTVYHQSQRHRYLTQLVMEQYQCQPALFNHRAQCLNTTQALWAPTALTKGTQTHGGGKNVPTAEEVVATRDLLVEVAISIDHPMHLSTSRWHST